MTPPSSLIMFMRTNNRWWDTKTTNDGGVVFDAEIRKFIKSHVTDTVPPSPATFTVTTYNPATFNG